MAHEKQAVIHTAKTEKNIQQIAHTGRGKIEGEHLYLFQGGMEARFLDILNGPGEKSLESCEVLASEGRHFSFFVSCPVPPCSPRDLQCLRRAQKLSSFVPVIPDLRLRQAKNYFSRTVEKVNQNNGTNNTVPFLPSEQPVA